MLLKAEKLLFYFLLFSLPFQTRKIIFLFAKPFNEYQSAYFYLTDVFIVLLLLLWFLRALRKPERVTVRALFLPLFLFLFLSGLSIGKAGNPGVSFWSFAKLLEMVGLFSYARANLGIFDRFLAAKSFVAGALLEAFIALLQFVFQRDLGLRFLGESILSPALAGVAKIDLPFGKLVRAYGTFPHPNVLGAFLLTALFIVSWLFFRKKSSFGFFAPVFSALLGGLFISFSRSALIVFYIFFSLCLVMLFPRTIFRESWRKASFVFFAASAVFCALLFLPLRYTFQFSPHQSSLTQRVFYNRAALEAVKQSPYFGVGEGNFVGYLKSGYKGLPQWQYQPVHNIYLLIASQSGLPALFSFLLFVFFLLFNSFKTAFRRGGSERIFVLAAFLSFLVLGFFDHYFFTLQQGQIMFWLLAGILASGWFSAKIEKI